MALLPGFEYDIFISYRHNDNRSGWVTEFVNALQEELAATIKEPLSIYFDKNPHDGLLETHNVDKSLEGKLKCLIFIPIISQTYCDPKSFAWQHEFCAFNEFLKESAPLSSGEGPGVRLNNGNFASRILPIKIHDLDAEDKSLIEKEIGGALRAIEFIYKEAGVNRPLKSTDSKTDNQNKTDYRNQVNKVANAVKEIITALKNPVAQSTRTTVNEQLSTKPSQSKKPIFISIALILLIALSYFVYQKLPIAIGKTNNEQPTTPDKSLAVLPFVDMSPGKDQEWFSDGLTEELLNSLSRLPELQLIARTSSFSFKGKNIPINKIADSLHVAYIVEGSVRKVGNQLRITAQLILADKGTHLWSNTYDRTLDNVFAIQEDIAENIANALDILLDDKKKTAMFSSGTRNVEAYEEYLKGSALYYEAHQDAGMDSLLFKAITHFEKAVALDKEFAAPYLKHQDFYSHYFIHHMDIYKFIPKDFSEQKIYQQITTDIDAAIRLEKNPAQKLLCQAEKITLSSDWSQWRPLIEAFKKSDVVHNFDFPGGFYHGILLITNPEISLQLMYERLKRDPLNKTASIYAGISLLKMNLFDSAARCFDHYQNGGFKWFVEFKRHQFSAALATYENSGRSKMFPDYILLSLVAGKYNGTLNDLHRYIKKQGLFATVFYNALGEYEKADSVAHVYDAKFLGPSSITDFFTVNPQCFRLVATPNFSARLRELGIDLVQYEKEHYYKFPVVKLKNK